MDRQNGTLSINGTADYNLDPPNADARTISQKSTHHALIHELFEEQVKRTPDSIAVVYQGLARTYAELNARANQLARFLRKRGVGPERLVPTAVERGLDVVVGVLGILRSGGAYVPLDPGTARQSTLVQTAIQSLMQALESAPQTPALSLSLLPDGLPGRRSRSRFICTRAPAT